MASCELESSICLLQRTVHHIETLTDFFQNEQRGYETPHDYQTVAM